MLGHKGKKGGWNSLSSCPATAQSEDCLLRDIDVVDILMARGAPLFHRGFWRHSQKGHNQESKVEDRHGRHYCKNLHPGDSLSHVALYVFLTGLFIYADL